MPTATPRVKYSSSRVLDSALLIEYSLLMERTQRLTATNLNEVIEAQGRRKRWLAEQVGVSESLIGKIALGQRTISAPLASKIALLLNEDVDRLFALYEQSETEYLVELEAA